MDSMPNPLSVVISPADYTVPVCEPERVADEIKCEYLSVYCKFSEDIVHLRIVAAGEILFHSVMCKDLTASVFDYEAMELALYSDDQSTYVSGIEIAHDYNVLREDGSDTGAVIEFQYGTYVKSDEPICFTGDFFPYLSPSCKLYINGGDEPINTYINSAN